MVDAGLAEADEFVEGEVIWDGDDEEKRGSGARVRERGVRWASKEVRYASAFAEFRVRIRWSGGELGGFQC